MELLYEFYGTRQEFDRKLAAITVGISGPVYVVLELSVVLPARKNLLDFLLLVAIDYQACWRRDLLAFSPGERFQ